MGGDYRMNNIMFIHDIIESNGKTIKENNLEKKHNIPIGCLVEINAEDCDEYKGVRLYVVYHSRDCDGTPLYNLCHNKNDLEREQENFYNHKWINGFSEKGLKIITKE
jgi:hypothetical protein